MQMHHRLAFGSDGRPMLYVFDTCRHFIRTLPALVYDQRLVEDVDTSGEDHCYDQCRYVLMENPIAPRADMVRKPRAFDPLSVETPYDPYAYYRRLER